jgi:subtilisin family serine protease
VSTSARFLNQQLTLSRLISVSVAVNGIKGVGMVTAELGAEWISLLASGSKLTIDIVDPASSPRFLSSETNIETGGFLSTFTSWGPTWEVDVKPQLAAPGGLILSTYPLALGGYAVVSGTSMACPLTAAVYALIASVRGTFDPATLENVLSATSNPNVFHDGAQAFPYLAPVAQQGAGLIQAYDAAHTTTLLSVSSLSFNDTDHFVRKANFTIRNLGTEDVSYSLSNVVAATAYTLDSSSIFPAVFPNELVPGTASLLFSEDKVTVPAGGSAMITVAPTVPADLDASRLPVYSGYIALNATNGESLSLPYLGVVGSLHDAAVLDKNSTYLTTSADQTNPVPANQTFVLPATNGTGTNSTVYPVFFVSLALGSPLIRADVVPQGNQNATTVLGARTLGNTFGFPTLYKARGGFRTQWDGTLEDGRYAPAGTYTLLIRALKIFGDAAREEDYETQETVSFSIRFA